MSELLLGVNIDHQVQAAFLAEQAGADGITVHLREDRRHITDRDVQLLRKTIQTSMHLEMAGTEEDAGIKLSLFIDADERHNIDFNTGAYANAANETSRVNEARC